MSLRTRMVLLALLLAGLVGFGVFVSGGEGRREVPPAVWQSSLQCRSCHEEVWGEWESSHHQIAYRNPEVRKLSDDFRTKECQACHLPRPVSITGYGKRTLARNTHPNEGVSCLTCHLGAGGEILARADRPNAPCAPRASAELVGVVLCASCHNQHWTTDQWEQTSYAAEGIECNDCHMPEASRAGARGRQHGFAASHHVPTLRSAATMDVAVEGGELVLRLENTGAGHNFPTEERSRAVDMMVRFEPAEEAAEWSRAHRFRLPYRSEPLPDTTLPAGERREIRVAIPPSATGAVARLWYRLTPFVGDDDPLSALLFEKAVDLTTGAVVDRTLATPEQFGPVVDSGLLGLEVVMPPGLEQLSQPPLPALSLEDKISRFERIAGSGPKPPTEDRLAELRDLVDTAFVPGYAEARLAERAKRNLLESDDAFWGLEEALAHDEPAVRRNAAYELGLLGEQASLVPLLLRLKYEGDPTVIPWVVAALAQLGNHATVARLIDLMGVAETADLAGLRAIEICRGAGLDPGEQPTWESLASSLGELRVHWEERGFAIGAAAVECTQLTAARLAGHLARLRGFELLPVDEARFVFSRMGVLGIPLLVEALHARDVYVRTHALEVVRKLGHVARAAAPDVLPLLGDELTRVDAVRVLGAIEARGAVPHLRARLRDSDAGVRAAAAGSLGPLGAAAARSELGRLWRDDAVMDVRVRAAFSAALLGDDDALAWLRQRLNAGDYHAPTVQELLDRL